MGSFDGVHSGHKAVIDAAKGYNCTAVIFSLPPKAFTDSNTRLIMTVDDRCEQLKRFGVNQIYLMDFEKFKDMTCDDFLNFLKENFEPDLIACGFNYRFGKGAMGDIDRLEAFCNTEKIKFIAVDCVKGHSGKTVSSSHIRHLISEGNLEKANAYLPQPFGFSACVIDGDHRGRTIGFPTINQVFPEELIKPKFGVYETVALFDNEAHTAITNFGVRPTYPVNNAFCETHIPDFTGNLYGKTVRISFKKFLRPEQKFDNIQQLKSAIIEDIKSVEKK